MQLLVQYYALPLEKPLRFSCAHAHMVNKMADAVAVEALQEKEKNSSLSVLAASTIMKVNFKL